METKTPLAELPGMDTIKIGPGGETFGQLKQAVLDARAAYTACLNGNPELSRLGDELAAAHSLLRAAYVRVGLPYVAP